MSRTHTVCPHCQGTIGPETRRTMDDGLAKCPACGKPNARRRARPVSITVAVGIVAFLTLGGASYSILKTVRQGIFLPARFAAKPNAPVALPARQASAIVDEDVDPSERSELRVFRGETQGATVLVLSNPGQMTTFQPGVVGHHGRLARELVRQAVLMAAREGLNLPVQDSAIGDPSPPGQPSSVIEVITHCPRENVSVSLRRVGKDPRGKESKGPRETLFHEVLRNSPNLNDYRALAEGAEAAARVALPKVLKKAGVAAKTPGATPKPDKDDLPEGVEGRLRRMSFVPQFGALRQLHAAVRSDGLTPRRVEALARAYANLGLLTEYQWDGSAHVYKSRGLLYAQRAVATDPKSPSALWHRAYVLALIGSLWAAEDDLNEAKKLVDAQPEADRTTPPSWVSQIEHYVRHAPNALAQAMEGPDGELAAVLRMMTLEFPPQTDISLRAARAAIDANPECFLAHDALCEVGGVANLHVATTLAPEILSKSVPVRIAGLTGIPEDARKAASGEEPDELLLTRALDADASAKVAAFDPVEPSWGALARVVRETRFLFTFRRLYFMSVIWNVPTGQYWEDVRSLVVGHRDYPFLLAFGAGIDPARLQEFARTLDTTDLSFNQSLMISLLNRHVNDPDTLPPYFGLSMLLCDWVVRDLSQGLVKAQNDRTVDFAHKLLMVSENEPYAIGTLIEHAWDEAMPKLDGWLKEVGDHPAVLAGMAKHYDKVGPPDAAERALKRSIEQSADLWAYQKLAALYKAQGNEARWEGVLNEFLEKVEDHGLSHAQVRVELANYYMRLGKWRRAQPYAEEAAKTWAGWAMECAGQCDEELGEYDRAEFWFRNEAERYPQSFMQWFEFCNRTGRGDVAAATQLAERYVENAPGLTENEQVLAIMLYDLSNQPNKGVAYLRPLLETGSPTPERNRQNDRLERWIELLFLARFADSVDNTEIRDQCWAEVAKSDQPAVAKTAAMFRDALRADPAKPFDQKAFDTLMSSTNAPAQSFLTYFAGHFLSRHGKLEDAVAYWERCVFNLRNGYDYVPKLATSAMRNRLEGKLPDNAHLYIRRGVFHRAAEKLDLALQDADEALRIHPRSTEALNFRGIVKRASGDLDGSIADFTRLIELAPNDPAGYGGRGITLILKGNHDEDATRDFDRTVELAPKHVLGEIGRGLLLLAQGKASEAEPHFDRALALDRSAGVSIEHFKTMVKNSRQARTEGRSE